MPTSQLTLVYAWKYGTTPIGDDDISKGRKAVLQHEEERAETDDKNTEIVEKGVESEKKSAPKPLAGWMTVRRTFKPTSTPISTSTEGETEHDQEEHSTTYSSRIAQTYRSVMEARAARRDGVPKDYYFCVLKGAVLFVYEDQDQSDVVAAIGVDKYLVGIENGDGVFEGKDAEMFAKRNAIVMRLQETEGLPVLGKGVDEVEPWFLFSKSNTR